MNEYVVKVRFAAAAIVYMETIAATAEFAAEQVLDQLDHPENTTLVAVFVKVL